MTQAEEVVKQIDEMYDLLCKLSLTPSRPNNSEIEVTIRTPVVLSELRLSEISILLTPRMKKPEQYSVKELFCGGNRLSVTYTNNIKISLQKPYA